MARRVPNTVPPPPPNKSDSSALIGDYWSPELGVLYRVGQRNGKFWLRHPRKTDQVGDFLLAQPNQRVRDVRFTKVMVTSVTR